MKSTREEQSNVVEDTDEMEERIRCMREIIDDLGTRITGKEKKEDPVKKRERPLRLMQYRYSIAAEVLPGQQS